MAISTGPSVANAVRVVNQRSCGSGSFVSNAYQGGSLIMTNAHVAGTRLGRIVAIDIQGHGRKDAEVIAYGYSSRTQTDWCMLFMRDFQAIPGVKMSKALPRKADSHYTAGHPRCQRATFNSDITTASLSERTWMWTPDAIGGQSGSAVWSDLNHIQFGLLTWSMTRNGRSYGAGQPTAWIWQQVRNRNTDGPARVEGMVEVNDELPEDCAPGYDDPAPLEDGMGVQSAVNLRDLPVWHDPTIPGPVEPDPDDPKPPTDWVEHQIEFYRTQSELYDDMRKKLETGIDPNDPDPPPSGGKVYGLMALIVLLSLCFTGSTSAQSYGLGSDPIQGVAVERDYGLHARDAELPFVGLTTTAKVQDVWCPT